MEIKKEHTNIKKELHSYLKNIYEISDKLNEVGKRKEYLNELFRNAHSIKGMFLILGLKEQAYSLNRFEEKISKYLITEELEVNSIELSEDLKQIKQYIDEISLLVLRVDSLNDLIAQVKITFPNLNISLNIETKVSKEHERLFINIIPQLILNSIKHGFGNQSQGDIRISIYDKNEHLYFSYQDSGRGLDLDKVRNVLEADTHPVLQEKLKEKDFNNIIFEPLFSTESEKTLLSGSGMGLNLVKVMVEKYRGKINLVTDSSDGFNLIFEF